MTTKSRLYLGVAALAIAVVLTGSVVEVSAQQSAPAAVAIDNDDIGGVVTGANGPEAGVWVIAETTDLPTRYAKMVVTDDQGRYVVPDLPKAKYKVWVRGYGYLSEYGIEKIVRDLRVHQILEGTNEIMRVIVARKLIGGN